MGNFMEPFLGGGEMSELLKKLYSEPSANILFLPVFLDGLLYCESV